jgi:hypothetical protein
MYNVSVLTEMNITRKFLLVVPNKKMRCKNVEWPPLEMFMKIRQTIK